MSKRKRRQSNQCEAPAAYDPNGPVTNQQLNWITKNQKFDEIDSTLQEMTQKLEALRIKVQSVRYLS
jgi:hypothetical protein